MTVRFGDIVQFAIGGGWGEDKWSEGTVPVRVIRGADFPAAELRNLYSAPLRYEPASKAVARTLREGDIVLEVSGGTKDRPTGRSIYASAQLLSSVGEDVIPASFCRLVRIDRSKASPRYVYYALQNLYSLGGTWEFQNQSTGISNFQFEMFRERWRLGLPALSDQQAIAEVLGALDDKIAANTAIVSKCREYALALTRVQTPSTTLGNVVSHRSRPVDPSTMTTRHVDLFSLPAFDVGGGPERVSPSEIKSGKFLVEGSVVLVSKLNPRIPRIWPIDEDGAEVPKLASTEFVVLDPLFCTPSFLWALLSQPEFTSALEGQVAGTSGSHQRVKPADLLAAPIPDPRQISPELHADVNAVLDPVKAALAENRTLAATRDALLPQLMSGKLRVRDAERIAEEAGA